MIFIICFIVSFVVSSFWFTKKRLKNAYELDKLHEIQKIQKGC